MAGVLFPRDEIESLRARVSSAAHEVVIPTAVDPVRLMRAAGQLFSRAQLMCHPDGTVAAGLGASWIASASGEARFATLKSHVESAADTSGPVFTGFSFQGDGPVAEEWEGFSSADALIPNVSIVATAAGGQLTVTSGAAHEMADLVDLLAGLTDPGPVVPFEPGDHSVVSHPPSAQWRTEVDEALQAIAQGDLAKVVLSRSVLITTDEAPCALDLVDHLRATYPQCYVFVWQVAETSFVGATPELLLEKRAGAVRANPLAGSARRGEGDDEDRLLGEALLHSPKDLQEHALVVQDIATRLGPVVDELEIPAAPSLRRMATVQHLSSEIRGHVPDDVHCLDLVAVMHPTPAVGGTPREEAMAFVAKVEGIDRGWYTGGIGWLTSSGDATFAIALRCALIRGRQARLYAGAGIVADSRAESELDETRLKFRPMLSVLTAT